MRRAEALSTKSTKLTFRAGAKRKGEAAAAATRITIKVPKKSNKPKPKPRAKPKPKPRAKPKPKVKPKFDLMDLLEEHGRPNADFRVRERSFGSGRAPSVGPQSRRARRRRATRRSGCSA